MIVSATPMILMLEQLGGGTFETGLSYSFAYLMLPIQVLATVYLKYFGYKTQTVLSWAIRTIFLIIPLYIAYIAPQSSENLIIWLFISSFFFISFFRATGQASLFPWLYHLLPRNLQGRYFSFDQKFMNLAAMLVLMTSSLSFYIFEIFPAFFIIYLFAILSSLGSIYALIKLPNIPHVIHPDKRFLLKKIKYFCLKKSPFRYYLIFNSVWLAAGTPFFPFIIYYLNANEHFTDGAIIFYTAIMYLGCIIASYLIRNKMDIKGAKPYLSICLCFCASLKLFWLCVLFDIPYAITLIPYSFIINGVAHALWQIAHYKYMPILYPKKHRALGISLQTAVSGLCGGLTSILWGYLLTSPSITNDIQTSMFKFYLFMTFSILVGLFFASRKLLSQNDNFKANF